MVKDSVSYALVLLIFYTEGYVIDYEYLHFTNCVFADITVELKAK